MLQCAFKTTVAAMSRVCVYKGHGMYEKDSMILHRELRQHLKGATYTVTYITPEEIIEGKLQTDVSLLVIGGGFDLGLIKSLGHQGMGEIKQFVQSGGSYLGICSGAYFAGDYIEFDKGGPLEVTGERFLKFFPGVIVGPLYKRYVYKSHKGAEAALVSFQFDDISNLQTINHTNESISTTNSLNGEAYCNTNDKDMRLKNKYVDGKDDKPEDLRKELLHADNAETSINLSIKTHEIESFSGICNGSLLNHNSAGCMYSDRDVTNKDVCIFRAKAKSNKNKEESQKIQQSQFKIFFNGGGLFLGKSMCSFLESQKLPVKNNHKHEPVMDLTNNIRHDDLLLGELHKNSELDISFKQVSILSHYLDLPGQPVAMVKCRVGNGVAVLSGGHFEYNDEDIEDENEEMEAIVTNVGESKPEREKMFRSVLKHLKISVDV